MSAVMVAGLSGCGKNNGSAKKEQGTSETEEVLLSDNTDVKTIGDYGSPAYLNKYNITFEDNFDDAAIAEMNKTVVIHGMEFPSIEYNFYYANEYAQLYTAYLKGYYIPVTEDGFLDMDGELIDKVTVRSYLQDLVLFDLQSEAFLLEYAGKELLELDNEAGSRIDSQFRDVEERAVSAGCPVDDYLRSFYGPDATAEGMRTVLERYELTNLAIDRYLENYTITEDIILPVVYQILYPTIDIATGLPLTLDDKTKAKEYAEEILNKATTLESFKAMGQNDLNQGKAFEAREYTVSENEMYPEIDEWCYDNRQIGDVGIVVTQYGYHVLYYEGTTKASDYQKETIAYMALQTELEAAIGTGAYEPEIS